jgi:hypothetical protein
MSKPMPCSICTRLLVVSFVVLVTKRTCKRIQQATTCLVCSYKIPCEHATLTFCQPPAAAAAAAVLTLRLGCCRSRCSACTAPGSGLLPTCSVPLRSTSTADSRMLLCGLQHSEHTRSSTCQTSQCLVCSTLVSISGVSCV